MSAPDDDQIPTAEEARAEVRRRFDDRAPTYDESAMHRGLADAVAEFVLAGDAGGGPGDVATGTGLVLRALRDRGARGRMIGVDLAPRMLEVARTHLPEAELIEADAASLPLPDDCVDLVTCVTACSCSPTRRPRSASGRACCGREAGW